MFVPTVLKLLKMAVGMRALLDTVMQALPQVRRSGLSSRVGSLPNTFQAVPEFTSFLRLMFSCFTPPVIGIASLPRRREVNVAGGFDLKDGGRIGGRQSWF